MCNHWPLNNLSCESFRSLEIWSFLFLWLLPSCVPTCPYCPCLSITADPELAESLIRHGSHSVGHSWMLYNTSPERALLMSSTSGRSLLPLTADLVKAGEKMELLWQPPFSLPLSPWGRRPTMSTLPISLLSPQGPRRLPFPFGNTIPVHLAQWHFLPHFFFYCSSSKAAFCFLTILYLPLGPQISGFNCPLTPQLIILE